MKINNLSRPKVPAPPPSESNGRPLIPEKLQKQTNLFMTTYFICLSKRTVIESQVDAVIRD